MAVPLASLIEYEVYVPTATPNLSEPQQERLRLIQTRLVDYFGGLTDTRIKNNGLWKIGSVTVRDEVVVWRILSDKQEAGDKFMRKIKLELETELQEETVLIVRREVGVL